MVLGKAIIAFCLLVTVACGPSHLELKMEQKAREAQEKTNALLERQKFLKKNFPNWPIHIRVIISQGKIMTGMTRQQVRMAMGKPHEISRQFVAGARREQWIYRHWRPDPEGPINYMTTQLTFQGNVLVLIEVL